MSALPAQVHPPPRNAAVSAEHHDSPSTPWKPDWRRHIVAAAPPVTTPPVDEQAVTDAQMAIEDMVARFG